MWLSIVVMLSKLLMSLVVKFFWVDMYSWTDSLLHCLE